LNLVPFDLLFFWLKSSNKPPRNSLLRFLFVFQDLLALWSYFYEALLETLTRV